MSGLGQKRTWRDQIAMSAFPPKADIPRRRLDVSFVPKPDILKRRAAMQTTNKKAVAQF
jgi:hypothetical protein